MTAVEDNRLRTEKLSGSHRFIGSHALVTTVRSGATGRCARSLDPRTPARQVYPCFGTCCYPRPIGPTTLKEDEEIRMTHNIHTMTTMTTMTTPATGPAATDTLADEAAIRELFAARAELASLGATASPSRLERALERLEAAQQASRRMLAQAA